MPKSVYNYSAWGILVIITLIGLYQITSGQWPNVFVVVQALTIGLVPVLLERRFGIYTPPLLWLSFVVFLFSTLVLGEIAKFYTTYWWWDIFLHGFSSLGITLIAFILLLLFYKTRELQATPLLTSYLAFSFAMSAAVLWEVYEFVLDLLFEIDVPMQASNTDTIIDLSSAIFSAVIACASGYRYLKYRRASGVLDSIIHEGKVNNIVPKQST